MVSFGYTPTNFILSIAFNIDYADAGVDHYPHSGSASAAPTRPPSRTSHHSGIGDTPMQSQSSRKLANSNMEGD
jgi:hypothetical protein